MSNSGTFPYWAWITSQSASSWVHQHNGLNIPSGIEGLIFTNPVECAHVDFFRGWYLKNAEIRVFTFSCFSFFPSLHGAEFLNFSLLCFLFVLSHKNILLFIFCISIHTYSCFIISIHIFLHLFVIIVFFFIVLVNSLFS